MDALIEMHLAHDRLSQRIGYATDAPTVALRERAHQAERAAGLRKSTDIVAARRPLMLDVRAPNAILSQVEQTTSERQFEAMLDRCLTEGRVWHSLKMSEPRRTGCG